MAEGALNFVATADNKQVLSSIEQMKQGFQTMERQAEQSGIALDKLSGKASNLAGALAGFAGISIGGAALVKQITDIRSEMQNTEAMFKVFLKSGEAASSFMERLQNYAFNNVFEFKDLAEQSAQLLAFGTAQDQVIDRLDRLSNVAAGANVPLQELVQVYNKVKATDSIDSMVEKSLSGKGIRIQQLLEQARGLDAGALEGVKFRFQDLEEALKAATDEGGMYFGMMEEKMTTLGDKLGLLQDSVTNMFNEMGQSMQDVLGSGIELGSKMADNWREIITVVGLIAAEYGAVKGAFALDKAFDNAQRLQALKFEQDELKKLDTATQKYTAALLKQQVAELQAAKSAGKLTTKQAKQLAEKEAELREMQKAINLQQAVDAGVMTEAEAKHIVEIQKARQEKHDYWLSVKNDLDEELAAQDELIAEEVAGWNNPKLLSAIENVRQKKEEVTTIQTQVDTNAAYIQQLKDEATELQNNGQAKEAAIAMEKLLAAEKEQETLVTQLQTAETELSTSRKGVDNIVTASSTASEELNALAREQAAKAAQREAASVALSATQTTRDTIATTASTKAKRLFAVATNTAKVAMKSFFTSLKASLASNPFGWIMLAVSGLVSLGTWLYKVFTAETKAEKAQNALNDAMGEAAASAENEIRQLQVYIGMIKSAKENNQDYSATKQKIINQFEQYDDNIRKEIDDIIEMGDAYNRLTEAIRNATLERSKQNYMSNISNTINENSKQMWSGKDGKGGIWGELNKRNIDGTTQGEIAEVVQRALSDAKKLQAADKNNNGKFSTEEIEQLFKDDLQGEYETFKNKFGKSWKGVMKKIRTYADDTAVLLVQQQGILEGEIMKTKNATTTDAKQPLKDVKALIQEIYDAQAALDEARRKYAENATKENKQTLEDAQSTYDTARKNYQLATQKQWQDAKTLHENLRKLELTAEKETIALEEKKVEDKRNLLDLQLRDRLADLKREEEEYNKNNNGGSAKSRAAFKKRRETIIAEVEFDRAQLDKDFREWKKEFEQQQIDLKFNFELSELERAINLEQDWNEKLAKQETLRNRIIDKIKEEARQTKEEALGAQNDPQLYGTFLSYNAQGATAEDKNRAVTDYINTMAGSGITVTAESVVATLQEMSDKAVLIDKQTAEKIRQQRKTFENEDYDMLADMLTNYLTYEEQKQKLDNDYNIARTKALNIQDEQLRARMFDAIEKDYQERSRELAEVIKNELFGLDSTLSKKLSTGAIDGITKVINTLRKVTRKEKLSDEESSYIQTYLGLTDEKMQTLQSNADVVLSLLNELEYQTSATKDFLGSSLSETVGNFFTQIGEDISKGTKPLTAFKEKLSHLFSADGIGQFAGVLSQAISQLNQALQSFASLSDDPATTQMAEVLGGIFQNFASAGQGAATGGWIGAIVAGVTDAIGQLSSAIMNDMSVMSEYRRVVNELEVALLNLRYSRMLNANGNSIFGTNNRGELTAALSTLQYVNEEWETLMGGLDQASVDFNNLFDLLDERGLQSTALITGIAAIGSPTGIIGAAVALSKYNKALEEYKGTTLETLVGGFNTWNQDNIKQYVEAVEKGYTSLEALQVKIKDYKLKKDKYASLKDLAPDIFNSDGTVNVDELDAFMSAYDDKLTSDQKLLLQKLRNNQDAYNESLEQALGYYEDLFGGVGSAIQVAFVDAFKNGEDALDNFTDSLESSVEQWVEDIAYAAAIAPILKQANDYVENAVKNGEDTDAAIEKAFDLIFGNLEGMYDDYSKYLNNAKNKYGDKYGMNLFEDEDAEGSEGFGQMTQDTADALNARFTALQIEGANVVEAAQALVIAVTDLGADSKLQVASLQTLMYNSGIALQVAQEQLDQLQVIANNTALLADTNDRLKAIQQNTSRL